METYTLQRNKNAYPFATWGMLYGPDGHNVCVTLELPWLDNTPDKSCIPASLYECCPHSSDEHPNVWEVQNVPGRSLVRIHNGNTTADTEGCILVGDRYGHIEGQPAVLNSITTMGVLRSKLPDYFMLNILAPVENPS
jgi:hypothetical protein